MKRFQLTCMYFFKIWERCTIVQEQSCGQCKTMQQSSLWPAQDRRSLRNKVRKLFNFVFVVEKDANKTQHLWWFDLLVPVSPHGTLLFTRKRKRECSHTRYILLHLHILMYFNNVWKLQALLSEPHLLCNRWVSVLP